MWKYTHTDEMYHSLTSQNNPDVLYHSDTYLGETYEDGLKHFKYIKREFVNGRWKYYYRDEQYEKYNDAYKKSSKQVKSNIKNVNKNNAIIDDYNKSGVIGRLRKKDAVKKATASNEKIAKRHQADVADTQFYNVARGLAKSEDSTRKSIAKGTIKVANAVSDTAYKTKKKIKKGKKAVKNALKKAFPETHTSTTYGGNSKTVTKYVNGKKVSEKVIKKKK